MKPVIGLTSQNEFGVNRKYNRLNYTYINAVVEGGGVPLIFPILKELEDLDRYLDLVDGIIFTGGEDLSPLRYGEEPMREVDVISYERDNMEFELFKRAYKRNMPILGICRGLQLSNISLGGTLYQDINKQVPNCLGHVSTYHVEEGYHSINIVEDSILHKIFNKSKISVNSLHHQAIKDLGKDLKITAISKDGIIEGIESTNEKFLLGVQFHPEGMITNHKEFVKIFNYFIEKCKG